MIRVGHRLRRLQTPLVTLGLIAFLVHNVLQLPVGGDLGYSAVGVALAKESRLSRRPPPRVLEEVRPIAWVVREQGVVRLLPLTEMREASTVEAVASIELRRDASGFWSVVHDTRSARFTLGTRTDRFTAAERDELRAMTADFVRTMDGSSLAWMAPLFETGDTRTVRIVWWGVLNNALVIVAAIACYLSAGWAFRYVDRYVAWRRNIELQRKRKNALLVATRCVRCAYDVRGLPGPCCPECGEVLSAPPTPA